MKLTRDSICRIQPPEVIYDFGALDKWTNEQIEEVIDNNSALEGFATWAHHYVEDLFNDKDCLIGQRLEELVDMIIGSDYSDKCKEVNVEYVENTLCMWGDDVCIYYRIQF